MADSKPPTPDPATAKAQAKADKAAQKDKIKAEKAAQKEQAKAVRAAEKEKAKSDAKKAEEKLLNDLNCSLKEHARSATFACGGSVDVGGIDIRFGESGKGITLSLPKHDASSSEFKALLAACQPASFGRGSEEVLDETYRKAGKLDRAEFAANFCPYEVGIVDVVSQLLLPQTKQQRQHRSIKAELYKLNVYSAPSGKFQAHVDTPRGETQFGSLVVCFPLEHEGGQLAVRNAGQELVFDWSSKSKAVDDSAGPAAVKWAAFYSDCEHEVLEVTAGHRLTLTYNLYATRGLGNIAGSPSALDPHQLPLYECLKSALENPRFFRRGRVLGIWLTHSYCHTNKLCNFLPGSLKGADMSLYETARAMDLRCRVVPIISQDGFSDLYNAEGPTYLTTGAFRGFNQGLNDSGNLGADGYTGWGSEIPAGRITWINESAQGSMTEAQVAYLAYGNEPDIDIQYSQAAMLIRVPPHHERESLFPAPENFWSGIEDLYAPEYGDRYDYDSYSSEFEEDEEEDDSEDDYDEDEDEGDEVELEVA